MKARADKQGGSKPAKKNGGQTNGASLKPAAYQAEILGHARRIIGWTGEGNLLLADGVEYVFRPLHEPAFPFRNRKLQAVAALECGAEGWLLNGELLERWLQLEGGPRLADKRGIPHAHRTRKAMFKAFTRGASAGDIHPDWFRNGWLRSELQNLDQADSAGISAVAWFHSIDERVGEEESLLLHEFWQIEGRAEQRAERPEKAKPCAICSWSHDDKFTLIHIPGKAPIRLDGILSDIVAQVHRAHEECSAPMLTKNVACGGYGKPSKAFYDLGRSESREAIFDTSKRGYIALRVGAGS